jgi:phosphoglycerol transferase
MAAFLIGTIGGFGSLFAFTVSPQLRAGHRISVYIAYFSLMGVLILLRRAEILWIRRKRRRLIVQSIAAAVLFAGLWDITPSSLAISPTELATVKSDMNFIHAIEAAVPPGAMIYQLPYHPFPEYGFTNRMLDYDPLRGYVYSSRLRWSYGAMKGRPADEWQKQVASLPVEQMVVTVAQAGFQGISIDREGYRNPDELIGRLTALLGVPPVGSADRRFVFFPMMKYAAGINRGGGPNPEILQLPVGISWHGCYTEPGKNFWCPYDAVLELENANAAPRQVHLQAVFQSANGTPASLSFGPPLSRTIDIGVGQEPVSLDLAVPPGRLNIKLHSDAQRLTMTADTRLLVFSVTRLETRGASTVAEPRQPIAIALTECTPGSGTDNFWCPFDGTLELTNPGTEPRRISVSADIQTAANDPAVLTLGGLVTKTLAINHTGVPFTADVLLPPGKHSITLHCAGKRYIAPMDPRVLVFSLLKLAVTDQ